MECYFLLFPWNVCFFLVRRSPCFFFFFALLLLIHRLGKHSNFFFSLSLNYNFWRKNSARRDTVSHTKYLHLIILHLLHHVYLISFFLFRCSNNKMKKEEISFLLFFSLSSHFICYKYIISTLTSNAAVIILYALIQFWLRHLVFGIELIFGFFLFIFMWAIVCYLRKCTECISYHLLFVSHTIECMICLSWHFWNFRIQKSFILSIESTLCLQL